jgi:hypothetical protein
MHSLRDQLEHNVKDLSQARVSLISYTTSTSTGLSGSTVILYLSLNVLVKTIFLYGPTALRTLVAFSLSLTFYAVSMTPWTAKSGRRKAATYTQNNTNIK